MKKYVTLHCSICDRKKDSLIDLTHYAPDRCTITLGCEGRLSPVGYTSDGSTVLGVPPIGSQNWYPRNSTITGTSTLKSDVLYDTSTGTKRQVIVGIKSTSIPAPTDSCALTVQFKAEQQTAKDYRQYVFRKSGSFTVLNGVESGVAKKVLRYTITGSSPDEVQVYVDGVKRSMGTGPDQYQLYDGTAASPVPPNSVLFNSPVTGVAPQVDVIVTKQASLSSSTLVFNRLTNDEGRVGTGAWEGVSSVSSPSLGTYFLFYCDFSEVSPSAVDLKLLIDTVEYYDGTISSTLDPSNLIMLLSRTGVHTKLDRLRAKYVPLQDLTDSTKYIITKLENKVRKLYVTEAGTSDVFPPFEVTLYSANSLQKTSLSGNSDSADLDNNIILGPDA